MPLSQQLLQPQLLQTRQHPKTAVQMLYNRQLPHNLSE